MSAWWHLLPPFINKLQLVIELNSCFFWKTPPLFASFTLSAFFYFIFSPPLCPVSPPISPPALHLFSSRFPAFYLSSPFLSTSYNKFPDMFLCFCSVFEQWTDYNPSPTSFNFPLPFLLLSSYFCLHLSTDHLIEPASSHPIPRYVNHPCSELERESKKRKKNPSVCY